ncbi:hypothetical protein, conserved [Angomonas deanei]|uniref:Inositol-polyphosphate 5-phosphatase n=1 Tax=Angomonas deanei TaxID=59799 RepID=A0A7G2CTC7_9TRYP|nr:hypothetical protein, conserved [Angomonas deanei]
MSGSRSPPSQSSSFSSEAYFSSSQFTAVTPVRFTTDPNHTTLPFPSSPSTLILTQNIGGITGEAPAPAEGTLPASGFSFDHVPASGEQPDLQGAPPESVNTQIFSPGSDASCITMNDVSQYARWQVRDFMGELRRWIHRISYHYARREGNTDINTTTNRNPQEWSTDDLDGYQPDLKPPLIDIIVIHFQEIGGKFRNTNFNEMLCKEMNTNLLPEAGWTSGFLMEHDEEHFTAIGSMVFLSPRVCPVSSMLSFPHRTFIPVSDEPRTYGGTDSYLFHRKKFSTAGKSRKGFLLISLRIGAVVLNICQVHLFHDADNRIAVQPQTPTAPNTYVLKRREAFLETLAEISPFVAKEDALWITGDLNVRLDGAELCTYATETLKVNVTADKKQITAPEAFWQSFQHDSTLLHYRESLDKELLGLLHFAESQFSLPLAELPVHFAPTYCRECRQKPLFLEGVSRGSGAFLGEEGNIDRPPVAATPMPLLTQFAAPEPYTTARLPAWCDRVVFNAAALEVLAAGMGKQFADMEQHDKEEPPQPPSSFHRPDEPVSLQERWKSFVERHDSKCYLYNSINLVHTDHDGVFLLF